jgi:hypothetical protein
VLLREGVKDRTKGRLIGTTPGANDRDALGRLTSGAWDSRGNCDGYGERTRRE